MIKQMLGLKNISGGGIVVPDFIDYWRFDNGSLVGENGTVSLNVGMTQVTGVDGDSNGAYNAIPNQYQNIPLGSYVPEYSISIWVKLGTTAQNANVIFTTTPAAMGAFGRLSSIYINNGNWQAFDYDGGAKRVVISGATTDWTHLVATFKSNDKIELYVNGGAQYSSTGIANRFSGYTITLIAHDSIAFTRGYLNGSVDNLRLYDRVLTSTEITDIYNAEL